MKHILNYYIGDPDPTIHGDKWDRGQDKHGSVHCLLWVYLCPKGFFAKPDEYAVGVGGGGIGNVKSIEEGRKRMHDYAVSRLHEQLMRAEDRASRVRKALETLGDDPARLERFAGDYNETYR